MLELFAVKFKCHDDGDMFAKDEYVFTVNAIDGCVCNIAILQPIGKEEWPEVSKAIQAALDCASKPIAECKMNDDPPQKEKENTLSIKMIEVLPLRLKAIRLIDLPVTREVDGSLWCCYGPWSLDVSAKTYSKLIEEVNKEIAELWKAYVLEDDDNLSMPALAVKKNLRADWKQIA